MRLWTVHPHYLDGPGLVALWREALLAQSVLLGRTRGYAQHPQLTRFQAQSDPPPAIARYLEGVWAEGDRRGYHFDRSLVASPPYGGQIEETEGQLLFEWNHLLLKLRGRAPQAYRAFKTLSTPRPHPMFTIVPGDIAPWERHRG